MIKKVSETLLAMQNTCDNSGDATKRLAAIAGSSEQQLRLTQEIVDKLEICSDTTKKNRSVAEGAVWTAKSLGQVSEQLDAALNLFRLANAIAPSDNLIDTHSTQLSAQQTESDRRPLATIG